MGTVTFCITHDDLSPSPREPQPVVMARAPTYFSPETSIPFHCRMVDERGRPTLTFFGWQTNRPNGVGHGHAIVQSQQGNVIVEIGTPELMQNCPQHITRLWLLSVIASIVLTKCHANHEPYKPEESNVDINRLLPIWVWIVWNGDFTLWHSAPPWPRNDHWLKCRHSRNDWSSSSAPSTGTHGCQLLHLWKQNLFLLVPAASVIRIRATQFPRFEPVNQQNSPNDARTQHCTVPFTAR